MNTSTSVKHTGAAGGATILATIVVWILGRVHVPLSAEDGSIIAGALSATVVFVWHYGLANIARTFIFGETHQAVQRG
jgi:hypothetical protein